MNINVSILKSGSNYSSKTGDNTVTDGLEHLPTPLINIYKYLKLIVISDHISCIFCRPDLRVSCDIISGYSMIQTVQRPGLANLMK